MTRSTEVHCTIMRGGTSKGVFLEAADLPQDPVERDYLVMGLFGSGDPRQIDGLGGSDVLTSKVAIIGSPSRDDADLDYTFGQVGIAERAIDWHGNCGNISAAVGVYAIEAGYVRPTQPFTSVRVHNTNTGSLLKLIVPVKDGAPLVEGDFRISGVPGTGAEIRLDFAATSGATTGRMLPTGSPSNKLTVEGLAGQLEVSILDVAKLAVFFRAEDVGLTGAEAPSEFTEEVLATFESIQHAAADLVGIDPGTGMPRPVAVAPPQGFARLGSEEPVSEDEVDFLARWVVTPPPRVHKAYAGTGAVCTGVAARLEGTVVHQVSRPASGNIVRIGHPSGVFPVTIAVKGEALLEASFSRTARRLMDGIAVVRM